MIRISDNSTPVVILAPAAYGPLGVLRSLGRLGVPVYIVSPDPGSPASYSRYCRGKFDCNLNHRLSRDSVARLLEISGHIGRKSILIPTTDQLAIFVDDHAEALREGYLFPSQPPGLPGSLASKKEMYYIAKKAGIPTAETTFPGSREDVVKSAQSATFPLMLKGIDTKRLSARAGGSGQGMFLVETAAELIQKYDKYEDPAAPNLMLQEYIPGGDDTVWMFNGYFDKNSDCLLGFTGRKIRQSPVYRGVTSLGICLKNEPVDHTTCRFMKAVGYRGILDIGYRYDARDGLYKVLDVNPRIGATFRLFVADNGMDVVRALYLDLTGQPIEPGRQREGRKWIVEDLDLFSSYCYRRDGLLTLKDWIGSFWGVEESAYFALDDPWPVWAMLVNDLRKILRRKTREGELRVTAADGRAQHSHSVPRGVPR
jgi:predicted ATP-grasp superfamily ATP-dependent carboligase